MVDQISVIYLTRCKIFFLLIQPGHRMNATPIQRGKYQRWGPDSNRFHGNQQRRQNHGNYRHQHYRNFQGRQWSNNESQEDDVMKLQPSDMMTAKEKEWLVKIQLMTLLTDDPQNTDYYYVVCWFCLFINLFILVI